MILNCEWLAISHSFFRRKNPKGVGEYPQQAGDDTTYVASKANACQTNILVDEI